MPVPQTEWFTLGFNISSPIEYEFQVVEYHDKNDVNKIKKVSLQTRKIIYNVQGGIKECGLWTDVPRLKVPYVGG